MSCDRARAKVLCGVDGKRRRMRRTTVFSLFWTGDATRDVEFAVSLDSSPQTEPTCCTIAIAVTLSALVLLVVSLLVLRRRRRSRDLTDNAKTQRFDATNGDLPGNAEANAHARKQRRTSGTSSEIPLLGDHGELSWDRGAARQWRRRNGSPWRWRRTSGPEEDGLSGAPTCPPPQPQPLFPQRDLTPRATIAAVGTMVIYGRPMKRMKRRVTANL
ncbi:hypothetical protein NL676_033814 [Syzygium grande]|nr:hypothetical protein NL676_033814 [Syzygium grande]